MSDYSVEEILRAKRVARENGYTVELPKDKVEQAYNIATAAGYKIKETPVADNKEKTPKVKPDAPAQPAPEKPVNPYSWEVAAKYL